MTLRFILYRMHLFLGNDLSPQCDSTMGAFLCNLQPATCALIVHSEVLSSEKHSFLKFWGKWLKIFKAMSGRVGRTCHFTFHGYKVIYVWQQQLSNFSTARVSHPTLWFCFISCSDCYKLTPTIVWLPRPLPIFIQFIQVNIGLLPISRFQKVQMGPTKKSGEAL